MVELPPIIKEAPEKGTHRVLLTVSYDGTAYAGWQWQDNAIAVQQRLEEALFDLCGEPIRVTGASRTDSGVHALGQRAHFDTFSRIPADRYPFALNTRLPFDIRILNGQEVSGDFHARFDAKGKMYTYRIHNSPHASAMYRCYTAHIPQKLNVTRMQESLKALLGTHDFAAFQASGGSAKTTVRTIEKVQLYAEGEELTLVVKGNAFLYNMVRIIAGTLCDIGMGRIGPDAFEKALKSGNRLELGITAPACGLELTKIFYDSLE